MSLEVYINEKQVELIDEKRIGLTLQVNNLGDLQTRQGNFTNQFRLLKTNKNTLALENAANLNSTTEIPYKLNKGKIIQDGIEITPDGTALIQSVDDAYNVQITAGTKNFFQLIQDLVLTALDFSEYDHPYDVSTVIFYSVDYGANYSGFIYPLIEWAKGTAFQPNTKAVNCYELQACLFVHTIIRNICRHVGYTVANGILADDDYYKLLVTSNFVHGKSWIENFYYKAETQTELHVFAYPAGGIYVDTVYAIPNLNFNVSGNPAHFTPNVYSPTTENIFATYTLKGVLWCNGTNMMEWSGGKGGTFTIQINDGGGAVLAEFVVDAITELNIYTPSVFNFEVSLTQPFIAGSVYGVRIEIHVPAGVNSGDRLGLDFKIYAGCTIEMKPDERIIIGSNVYVNQIMPNIKAGDFIKGIMNCFGITPTVLDAQRVLILNKTSKLGENLPLAKDWSKKIDLKFTPEILFRLQGYAQKNRFLYSNNEDCPDELIDGVLTPVGSGYLIVEDETLELISDVVTVPFGATKNVLRFGNYVCPIIPYRNTDSSCDSFTPRLLMLDRTTVVETIDFSGTPETVNIPFCYFVKEGASNNLSFSDSLLEKYYAEILSMFTNYKKVTLHVKLTAIDISELDFLIPIYLNLHTQKGQINGFFYLNLVSNYKGNESTKIELIRL